MDALAGDRIRQARLAAGISVEWLAAETGVTVGTVRSWERGRTAPTGELRRTLAHWLRVEVWRLWPPEDNLAGLSWRAQRLLLGAAPRRDGLYFLTYDHKADVAAGELARLWLVKDSGPHSDGARRWWVTPAGQDVLDLIHAQRQPVEATNGR